MEIGLYRRYLRREDGEDIARRMARAIEVDAEVGGWFPELQALRKRGRSPFGSAGGEGTLRAGSLPVPLLRCESGA